MKHLHAALLVIVLTVFCLPAAAFYEADPGMRYEPLAVEPGAAAEATSRAGIPWRPAGEPVVLHDEAVSIPVDAQADYLYFLHTFEPGPEVDAFQARAIERLQEKDRAPLDPPVLFYYDLVYADREVFTVPVRWMDGIGAARRPWWIKYVGILTDLPWARVAERTLVDTDTGAYDVRYAMKVVNPRPGTPIASVRMHRDELSGDLGRAELFAVTLGRGGESRRLWVDPTGSDADADGSFKHPWATIHHALAQAQPGDTVYVREGTYAFDRIAEFPRSGTPDAWITLSGLPGELAVVDGRNAGTLGPDPETLGQRMGLLHGETVSYIKVHGLGVQYSGCQGITFKEDSTHLKIFGNRVWRTCESGIGVWRKMETAEGSHHIQAYGNFLHMTCSTDTHAMFGREFTPPTRGRASEECLDAGGIVDYDYAFNIISFGDKESIDCKGPVRRGEVRYNYAFHCGSLYIDAWNEDIMDIHVHHNVSHNSYIGMKVSTEGASSAHNVTFHNNLAFNSISHGFNITSFGEQKGGWKNGVHCYHNTLHANGGHGIAVDGLKVRDTRIHHNVVTANERANIATADFDYEGLNLSIESNLVDRAEDPPVGNRQRVVEAGRVVAEGPIYQNAWAEDFRLRPGLAAVAEWPVPPGAFPAVGEWLPPLDEN